MKFLYEYRTSDNAKHNGVVNAADREAAFALIKSKGIKPSRLTEAPGFFNKLFGKGKRWIAIVVLSVIAIASFSFALRSKQNVPQVAWCSRSQIYGDPSVLQRYEATEWTDVFQDKTDRFLARYAIPGRPVNDIAAPNDSELVSAARRLLPVPASAETEVRRITMIVNGMKNELARYLAAGGRPRIYVERLRERQKAEVIVYKDVLERIERLRAKWNNESLRPTLVKEWNARNEYLRDMGMRSIPLPDGWEL